MHGVSSGGIKSCLLLSLEASRYGTSSTDSFILWRHPVWEESPARQVMMVEAASTLILHILVETLEYDPAVLTRACVVPLLKVVARSSGLGIKFRDQPTVGLVIIAAHAAISS
jgi:hypothetical protein